MAEVKLHGAWLSSFCYRVIWALKLKGIPYEYVEEDLDNKSPFLLHNNPVHKKVPVLIHGGKTICESMIILEYIDETWPKKPLFPTDPFERAKARFWIKFIDDKIVPLIRGVFTAIEEEEREKVREEIWEVMRRLEEEFAGERISGEGISGEEEISAVDLGFGWILWWLPVFGEVVDLKLFEEGMFPELENRSKRLWEVAVIGENLPEKKKMVEMYKRRREQWLAGLIK